MDSKKQTESIFDASTDTSTTRRSQLLTDLDLYVFAPARIIWTDWRARIGGLMLLFYLFMGTIGPLIIEKPIPFEATVFIQPFQNWQYPLGTNGTGQDIFGLLIHATPTVLLMAISGALFTVIVGTAVGLLSGYKMGITDTVLMTISDMVMAIPGLPLVIVVAVLFQPQHPILVGIIVTINRWAGLARAIRSQVLTIREESYVEASYTMGISTVRILFDDLLSNLMPYISMRFVEAIRAVIFASVALYFLGILPFTNFNWGVMLNNGYQSGALSSSAYFHTLLWPMLAIIGLAFGTILLAQGMDRLFNPRIRAKYAKSIEDDSDAP